MNNAVNKGRIADVPTNEFDFASRLFRQIIQPTIAIKRIVLSKSCNFGSRRDESFCQVRANEPVGSCYQDLGTKVAPNHLSSPSFLLVWPISKSRFDP